jgi:tetratricopeptide (TPR) repeat protein
METQQLEQKPNRPEWHNSFPLVPLAFGIIIILCIAIGVSIWIYLSPLAVIPYALLTGLGLILTLLQSGLFSAHKSKTSTEPTIILQIPQAQATPLEIQAPSTDKITTSNQSFPDRATHFEPSRQSKLEQANLLEPLPAIWNVPYQRNPFFTGRQDVLLQLHSLLRANTAVAMAQTQAISGLGGIGKTQIASEYAYRYYNDYRLVLWVKSSSREELVADYIAIAVLLDLPKNSIQDQSVAVNTVKRWLETHPGWLLILDNADDLAMVRDYLPFGNKGHILLTTRSQTMSGLAQRVEIEKMGREDGVLFLLRRAGIIAPSATLDNASETDRATALEIVRAMDGLPLALDQAGAYIEETKCGLSSYLTLYRTHRAKLLDQRGGLVPIHPEPVTTTWSLSFENVEQASPAAAELLRLCSFLAPDTIPEEIFTEGAPDLGPVLHLATTDPPELNAAIRELLKYSLIHRDPYTKTLTIHRLVQAVFKDAMDQDTQCSWAERTVKAINRTFPEVEFESWFHCQRLLPHAQVCKALIEEWDLAFPESAQLLHRAGHYLLTRTQYLEAEPFVQGALAIREKVLGPEHPDTAASLNNLTWLYQCQGKYEQAEPLMQRALTIWEKALGPENVNTAISINDLINRSVISIRR